MTSLRTSEESSSSRSSGATPDSAESDSLLKVLPTTAASWRSRALFRGEPVEAGRDEGLQGLGDVERSDRPRRGGSWRLPG